MVELKLFKCKKCGSVVVKLNKRGCPPSCCGEPMHEMHPNETDGAKEKHVPAVEVAGDVIKVQVGSVAHPMLEEHYIGFIALRTDNTSTAICTDSGRRTSDLPMFRTGK